ncbi:MULTISPECIES: substrate-binding domain-containing protein [unclassified Streptomyces]|jgi:DNA-binding LacI/PurR family transcriptional regulator|uniref:substrate-binding domain-containing protein n=1 Tax=unclassified Streptomyces TaxID=2593676 RepID=UPI002476AAD4|nr:MULTISPECIES: substrate-binding domain-containing protein [unclassified Streptomyces]
MFRGGVLAGGQRWLAIGAMHALADAGVRVPEDIAVIGVDGMQEGEYSSPTLAPRQDTACPQCGQHTRRDHRGHCAAADAEAPYRLLVRGSTAKKLRSAGN